MSDRDPAANERYRILGHLSSGGMGEVFLAEMRAFAEWGYGTRKVVIKRVKDSPRERDDVVRHFLAEVAISWRLEHQNIVRVVDFGTMDGLPFVAMEFVDGLSLWDLSRVPTHVVPEFPTALKLYVLLEAMRGLDYAHRRTDDEGRPLHLVHRDLNPANVLISFEGEVKLADFGLSVWRGRDVSTEANVIKGRLDMVSPEQIEFEPVDQRTDIYQMGLMIYRLLTGIHPFPTHQDLSYFDDVLRGVPESSFEHPAIRGLDLAELLREMMAVDPADRLPSIRDAILRVERVLADRGWFPGATALADLLSSLRAADAASSANFTPRKTDLKFDFEFDSKLIG
ncbi:serine/threonine protein kinase [bacterium]|nr:serine/threonine protein kinase [bacterium]